MLISWLLRLGTAEDIWLLSFETFTKIRLGFSHRIAGDFMVDLINANPDLLPDYEVKIAWQDIQCDVERTRELLLNNFVH